MSPPEIKEHLLKLSHDLELEVLENTTPEGFKVQVSQLKQICQLLKEDSELYFDHLSCITGIDSGPDSNTMEVLYHLYSITKEISLTLKVYLERSKPVVSSLAGVWKSANWHEREAYDLLGIHFEGHPDLRRILLPNDWEGYPLRKDYQEQKKYHGINVVYDRDDD